MEETVKTSNVSANKSELWNLSFRDIFFKYVRFLPLIVLSVALSLFGAYLYLRYTIPVYSVGGTMLIKSEQPGSRSDKFEEMFVNNGAQNIQNEMEILRSRPLMQRVVEDLGLQFSYLAKGKIKTVNVYKQSPFEVRATRINDSSGSFTLRVKFISDNEFRINDEKNVYRIGQVIKNNAGDFIFLKTNIPPANNEYIVTWRPSVVAAGEYSGGVTVNPKIPGTGILSVSMRTTNSYMGADIVNKLMELYGDYSIEQKQESSEKTLTFIDERLKEYGVKVDSIQQLFLDYQTRHNLIDAETQSGSYFDIIGEADKSINEQIIKQNLADDIDDYLSEKKNEFKEVPVVPSSLGLDDPTLNELVGAYNKAQQEREQLINSNVPEANPIVKNITEEIERLRVSIRENLKNIKSSVSAVAGRFRERSNLSESQLKAMPEKMNELAEIKRQVEISQELFKFLQEKREETAITSAATISNSSIIDKAFPSTVPVKPNRRAIQILAILLGLGLPAVFIFVGELLNDKVTTRFDIEKLTEAPILGEIGHSYSDSTLVVNKTTRSMVAEQFRIIRSNLQYVLNKNEKATILVTSSFSGEGKSYVSINMGAVLALAGKKTIILEFDIRKPKVLSGLGLHKGQGITNYMVGKANLPDLVRAMPEHENLFVMGCGPVPPNPAELLLDPRLEEMFTWLRANFDIILVDTAPVGMVSDAMTLSKFADCTLYLVRQGHTFKKQVALIDEFYKENKLPKVSIIINDVKLKPGYGYYGYGRYGYGYGYGYGSYYEEETAPQNLLERFLSLFSLRKWRRKFRKKQ